MTLAERLERRLRKWQADAKLRRLAITLTESQPANEAELAMLERCANELAADLMARNDNHRKEMTNDQVARGD